MSLFFKSYQSKLIALVAGFIFKRWDGLWLALLVFILKQGVTG